MRTYLLAAVAAAAIASPAVARDGSGYVGVELGPMITEDTALDYSDDIQALDDAFTVDYNTGYDADIIGGYDFGMVRAEAELAYKRAGVSEVLFGPGVATNTSIAAEADGRMTALSAMGNVLVDFGDDDGWSGYIGGGVGVTRVKLRAEFSATFPTIPGTDFDFSDSDSGFAWQLIAGVRTRVTDKIDLGLKYRLFNVGKLEFGDSATDARLTGQLRTHSLLASLIYNFYTPPPPVEAAPPPPPPPPPPPATQTCPDGSVILATEACPAPPPPPPPPPPAPERG